MDLYGQEPEARLLASFLARLPNRTVIDVGAERGAFVAAMLEAGADAVHAIEPEPDNVEALRERFGGDARVAIHALAASDAEGSVTLRRSFGPDGTPIPFGHTLLPRPDTDDVQWRAGVTVRARTLASLVEDGDLPARVGILKIDTEGHDYAVLTALGRLDPDVVMVEHWVDLPRSLGACPWTSEQVIDALAERDFTHYAFIVHNGEFTIVQWLDAEVPVGAMGNLVFLHDRVVADVLPDLLGGASALAKETVSLAETFATAARERLEVIDELVAAREREQAVRTATTPGDAC